MTKYIIFVKTELNLSQTYFQNESRGRKFYEVNSKDELNDKIQELINNGEKILDIKTAMGTSIYKNNPHLFKKKC